MADKDHRASAEDAVSRRHPARPLPAAPPVIDVAPAEARDAGAAVTPREHEPVDSSLVGEGGLPPASPAESSVEPSPVVDGRAEADEARDAPVVADAPDPGPTIDSDGPPPRLAPAVPPASGRKGGFWPLFLGGVVAAGLGSAATIWALPNLRTPPEAPPEAPAIDEAALRADTVAAAQAEVAARTDALLADAREAGAQAGAEAARSAIAEAAAAAPGDEDTAADLEAAQQLQSGLARIEELSQRVEALEARPAATEATAEAAPEPAAAEEIAALREELAAQAQRLEALAAQPQPDPAALEEVRTLAQSATGTRQQIEAAAAAVEERLAAAEAEAAAVEERVAAAARRTEALAAIASLEAALQTGGDRAPAVQGLEAAGVAAPEALSAAAPSLEELQESYPEAARAALRASLREAPATGGNTVTNFLRAQTGARSVEPRPGDDPDAVLSRAGAAVDQGAVSDALTELESLPMAGREAMAEWLTGAEAWAAAAEALGQVQGNLN